ncbi:MAG: histidine triad nucleotide-binding protein [Armatimonadetes bacterium]|nr:histidine triad nucleotide-binding protein [Armatimonadota bacterium]MDE2207059.1 histidine triad nucleotide-binding protein [Armatimonadota bacterium]
MTDCVFCRIGSREIPASVAWEDEEFLAFQDLNPMAPVHVLVIPKQHIATLMEITDVGLLGRAMLAVQQVARVLGISEHGFRVVANIGDDGGMTVGHLHFHLLGGRQMHWPPG